MSLLTVSTIVKSEEQELSLKQMLLTPGDLTEAHAELETKCKSCHVHFQKSNQTPLCLDCHERINDDLIDKVGFHGLLPVQQTRDCKSCHTDHQGRNFDIRGLDRENFEHSKTNFPLDGQHKNIGCTGCHADDTGKVSSRPKGIGQLPTDGIFRFKKFECNSCHLDFHESLLGDKCENCHTTSGWNISQFEHDKTDFPLDGKHKQVACSGCHIDDQYKNIDTQCQSCHLAKEPHLGIFGKKCIDCHTTEEWQNKFYNHLKETGYHLKDSHVQVKGRKIKCIDCHFEKLKPQTKCIGCHQADDIHHGNNGNQCQDCHNQKSWKKTDFNHDQVTTGFALLGKHKTTHCDSCHIPGDKRKGPSATDGTGLVRGCIDCHQADDPHYSNLGKECGRCHQTEGWQKSVRFNHDFSHFPLTGSHQLLVCESCHLSSEFSDQPQKCISCHKVDDYHVQSLGEQCELCHDTSVWGHWQFDHQRQTNFSLNNSHQNLQCKLCHNNEKLDALKPSKDCYSCHRDDDVHNGGFGVDCQQCHSEDKFEDLIF